MVLCRSVGFGVRHISLKHICTKSFDFTVSRKPEYNKKKVVVIFLKQPKSDTYFIKKTGDIIPFCKQNGIMSPVFLMK